MWGEADSQWKNVVNPTTGQGFSSYGDYANWAKNMEGQGSAASSAFGSAKASDYAWGGETPNWSKTGWNIGKEGKFNYGNETFTAPNNTFGFQIGDKVGYLVPQTGQIAFGSPGGTGAVGYDDTKLFTGYGGNKMVGEGYGTGVPGAMGVVQSYGSTTGGGYWDINADYGLGSSMRGIIPLEHNDSGNVSQYLAPAATGGFIKTPDMAEAIASRDSYIEWMKTNPSSGGIGQTSGVPQATTAATAPTTGATTGSTSTTTGELMVPGEGEKFYDSTKGFYTSPTEGHKAWEQTANQPTKMEQNWNAFYGQYNQPSNAEQQWASQKDFYGNPAALDDFYKRQEEKARGALSARASAAGIGDSSTAARAVANLGLDYSDRLLAARQEFDKTGMGLAQNADTGFTSRATGARTLAEGTDKSILDKVRAGIEVDAGDLARISSGAVASGAAQNAKENRLTGGLNRATSLANDISNLVAGGLTQAQATQMAPLLSALEVQYKQGSLTADQAYKQASETAATLGISTNTILQYMLATKFAGGTTSGSSTPQVSIPGDVSMPVTAGG